MTGIKPIKNIDVYFICVDESELGISKIDDMSKYAVDEVFCYYDDVINLQEHIEKIERELASLTAKLNKGLHCLKSD